MQRETALLHQIAHMILFHIVYVFKLAIATSFKRQNKGYSNVMYFDLMAISNAYISFYLH